MAFVREGLKNAFVVFVVLSQVVKFVMIVLFIESVVFVMSVLFVSVLLVQFVPEEKRGMSFMVVALVSDWTYFRSVELFLTSIRDSIVPSIVGELIKPL